MLENNYYQPKPIERPVQFPFGESKYFLPTSYYASIITRSGRGQVQEPTFWGHLLKRLSKKLPQDYAGVALFGQISYDADVADSAFAGIRIDSSDPNDRTIAVGDFAEMVAAICRKIRVSEVADMQKIQESQIDDIAKLAESIPTKLFVVSNNERLEHIARFVTGLPIEMRGIEIPAKTALIIRQYSTGHEDYIDFVPVTMNQPGWVLDGTSMTLRCDTAVGSFSLVNSRFSSQEEFRLQHQGFNDVRQMILLPEEVVSTSERANRVQRLSVDTLYAKVEERIEYSKTF